MSTNGRIALPPSEAQIRFATDLGLAVTDNLGKVELSRLIKKEVRRRGRGVLRQTGLQEQDVVRYPPYGYCTIDRIGRDTLKVTLKRIEDGTKKVTDAMNLTRAERVGSASSAVAAR